VHLTGEGAQQGQQSRSHATAWVHQRLARPWPRSGPGLHLGDAWVVGQGFTCAEHWLQQRPHRRPVGRLKRADLQGAGAPGLLMSPERTLAATSTCCWGPLPGSPVPRPVRLTPSPSCPLLRCPHAHRLSMGSSRTRALPASSGATPAGCGHDHQLTSGEKAEVATATVPPSPGW